MPVVSKSIELSSVFQAIIGGEYPKHFIDIKGRLDEKDDIMFKVYQALETKVAILAFQSSLPWVLILVVVAARSQSNKDSDDFIKYIEL